MVLENSRTKQAENTIPSVVGDAQKAAKPLRPGNHSGAQSAHSQNHSPHVDITQNSVSRSTDNEKYSFATKILRIHYL